MSRNRFALAGLTTIALAILGVGLAQRRPAGTDAGPLVVRAERAVRTVSRTGRMRTRARQNGQPIVSEVDVTYAPGGMHRLTYRTPPLQGVLCVANPPHMWRYDPQRRLLEESTVPVDQPSDLKLLLSNYDARKVAEGRVAGRPADAVVLFRRHGRGVARRLWLDRETGLPLRTEEYDAHGNLAGNTEYLSIRMGVVPAERFRRPQVKGVRTADVDSPASGCGMMRTTPQRPLLPRRIPAGYHLEGTQPIRCFCGCGQDLVHTEYTDGLEGLSLFECSHATEQMQCAATSSFAQENVASRVYRGHTFVAVGRVSARELQRMLSSIR